MMSASIAARERCVTFIARHTSGCSRNTRLHFHTTCDQNIHLVTNAITKHTLKASSILFSIRNLSYSSVAPPSDYYVNSNCFRPDVCRPEATSTNSKSYKNHQHCSWCLDASTTRVASSAKNNPSLHSMWNIGCNYRRHNLLSTNNSKLKTQSLRDVHTSARCRHWNLELAIKKQPPWKVLFFGNDRISVATLDVLFHNLKTSGSIVEKLDVVTSPQKTNVRRFAEAANIRIQDWPVKLQPYEYDVGVLASFGHLIPDSIIGMFPYGIVNMHPSKLPRWRGASPIIHTVLHGDRDAAVCITEIRPRHFDIGPIMEQRIVPVPHRCTSGQLTDILAPIGGEMILESLEDLHKLERYEHEQDPAGITYAHIIKRSHFGINWREQTSEEVDQQYRALGDMDSLKSEWKGFHARFLDIVDPSVTNNVPAKFIRGYHGDFYQSEPGTPALHTQLKCLLIKCKTGAVGFNRIVIRKTMPAIAFFNGYIQGHEPDLFTSMESDLYKYTKTEKIPKSKPANQASPPRLRALKAQHS